jgi:hypothetical protein
VTGSWGKAGGHGVSVRLLISVFKGRTILFSDEDFLIDFGVRSLYGIVYTVKFHVTKHFALRLAERDISIEFAKSVVIYSQETSVLRRGRHKGTVKKYRKTVDGRTLVVVAEMKSKECWFLTAYYED